MVFFFVFFFNDTATTEIYTLSLHDALPICCSNSGLQLANGFGVQITHYQPSAFNEDATKTRSILFLRTKAVYAALAFENTHTREFSQSWKRSSGKRG